MIFPVGEVMGEKERGRLCTIQMDGSDSLPFIIKKDKLLIGRADSCEIRMYIIGVAPEHCIITFNEEGRGFIEPVNKCGLLYLNGDLIERQVSLEHNDVITVVKRSFRFFYPTSSKFYVASPPTESCEMNMVEEHFDFEPEDALTQNEKEASERRVTFGPRLSPEEFDRNMPPASPLRKGSLPGSKLKAKTSVSNSDSVKSHIRRNLFRSNQSADSISYEEFSEEHEIHQSTVVLHELNDRDCEHIQDALCKENDNAESRPLFSDILKKPTANPPKNVVNKPLKKYSPKRLKKKTIKLKDSKRAFYKSPRRPVNPRLLAVSSTGHANSPETIIICKKKFNRRSGGSVTSSAIKRKSLRSFQGKLRASTSSEDHPPQAFDRNTAEIDFHQDNPDSNYNRPETLYEQRESIPQFETRSRPSTSKQNLRKSKGDDPTKKNSDTSPRKSNRSETDVLSSEETENAALATERSENIAFANDRTENAALTRESCTTARESTESNNINRERGNETPRNQNENAKESSTSPLAAVIDNVAHIDEHNIDKSLKDIHNAVLALSYPQSSVGSEPSGDMCMNAVKKLALTISMVNAFHMYNRIIDDVSAFPFCLPSTSFDASKSKVNCFQKTVPHQNEEISEFARASWFQDIMHNFFSSTNRNEYDSGMCISSNENEPGPSNFAPTSFYSRKSKKSSYMSKGKVPLRAIDSGSKPQRKSKSPHNNTEWIINDDSEMIQLDGSKDCNSCHECGASIKSSLSEVPESSMPDREKSHARTSRHSTSFGRDSHPYHSPQNLESSSSHDLSLSKSARGKRKSLVARGSISKRTDEIESFQNNSVQPSKQFRYLYKNKSLKSSRVLRRIKGPAKSTYTKLLRSRNPVAVKRKRVSFVAKKLSIRAAKKLKERRKERKHRINVLNKVVQEIVPLKNLTVKAFKKSPDLAVHSNQAEEQVILQDVKDNRVSQKVLRNAKSIKSNSASENLNVKSVVSPKLLRKRNKKRKSILFNRKGQKNRKSITIQRKFSITKDLPIDLSLLETKNVAEEQKIELEESENIGEEKKVPKKRGKQVGKHVAISKGRKRKSMKITDSANIVNDSGKSQVTRKKTVRKYRKSSSPNTDIVSNIVKGLPSPKVKTRRGKRKVNESLIAHNMSCTGSLNSEVILEEKNTLSYEKEEQLQETSTESQLLESKSPQIKAKTRKGRKKINENITVSDVSSTESQNSRINLEENSKNKRPYKKRETKKNKKADIETITIEENLPAEESEVSIITPQLKRGRKRILAVESEASITKPQVKRGRKRILAADQEVALNEVTEQNQTKRKKVGICVVNSTEHSTDVALTENKVLSDKKKSQRIVTKSKPQQGISKRRSKKTEAKASPIQRITRTLRSRK